jgi:hypothetical protein
MKPPYLACAPGRTVEIYFSGISIEAFSIASGIPALYLIPTAQNRDTWRRSTLTKAGA